MPQKSQACALCAITDPTVFVTMQLDVKEDRIRHVRIEWEFTKLYTQGLQNLYDYNQNLRMDEDEWKLLKEEGTGILRDNHYHFKQLALHGYSVEKELLELRGEQAYFTLDLKADIPLSHQQILTFQFLDENGFLGFFAKGDDAITLSGSDRWRIGKGTNLYASAFLVQIEDVQKVAAEVSRTRVDVKQSTPRVERDQEIYLWLAEKLNDLTTKMRDMLEQIKDGNLSALLMLLGFSFLYGMVHAAGPGHGKALVGSYFLANDRSYAKAIMISLLVGVIHIFSALMFTLAVILIVKGAFNQALEDSTTIVNLISGVIIVAIALYLLSKRIRADRHTHHHAHGEHHHYATCGCSGCSTQHSTDLGIALSAGILPCPGTVTVFIFTFSLGLYLTGLLAAIFMSLGMSLVIALSALTASALQKRIRHKLPKLILVAEYGGLLMILLLGTLLALSPVV